MDTVVENTSGRGKAALVPPEIDRWNWGAFLLNWIWGLGNGTPIALLAFIPLFGIVWVFVLGAKGSAWAWRNRRWDSIAHFKRVQRRWAILGLVALGLAIAFGVAIVFLVFALLRSSEPYRLGVAALHANAQAAELLGDPIATGSPSGSIHVSDGSGDAAYSFSASGPKSHGTIYLKAKKSMGTWHIEQEELAIDGRPHRIELAPAKWEVPSPGRGPIRLGDATCYVYPLSFYR